MTTFEQELGESISIHAPRKAERPTCPQDKPPTKHFNPRSAQGGATAQEIQLVEYQGISIHAPRKAERRARTKKGRAERNFNPRSAQGGATCYCRYL